MVLEVVLAVLVVAFAPACGSELADSARSATPRPGGAVGELALPDGALSAATAARGPRLLVFSDVHDDRTGARLAVRVARELEPPADAVLIAGDMTIGGSRREAAEVARWLRDIGAPVIAVAGNHDRGVVLQRLRRAGWAVLEDSSTGIDGLLVYGASYPRLEAADVLPDADAMEAADRELARVWPASGRRPDVVLVHDPRQALSVGRAARQRGAPLVVVSGHTHEQTLATHGTVTVLGAGTAGAYGFAQWVLRRPPARDYQILDFAAGDPPRLRGVTILRYLSDGRRVESYVPVGR